MTADGADLARRQLLDLVEVAGGAVEVLEEWTNVHGNTAFTISLDTSGLEHAAAGITVRARERFKIIVNDGFPFVPPSVFSVHRRWARTPHVQWGSSLCLYAAPSVEWNPTDGMRGFIGRLSKWVENAAAGTLDPDGQPLHPPAVYTSADAGRLLVHPDLGNRVPWASDGAGREVGTQVAWCAVNNRRKRVDVLEWVDTEAAIARAESCAIEVFHGGRPVIVIPVVLTPDEFGSEYPDDVKSLSAGLAESGYDRDSLLNDLAACTHINRKLRARQVHLDAKAAGNPWDETTDEEAPLFTAMLVGTPSRRVEGDVRLAHLAAWKLDALSAAVTDLFAQIRDLQVSGESAELQDKLRDLAFNLFDSSPIAWMRVMETRPEVTRRRDQDTPSSWLAGRRVLVLGSGALGAPISEFCVRAGVKELTVADYAAVNPGILVRQPYNDADIGLGKAHALAKRLSAIRDDLDVTPSHVNVRSGFFAPDQDLGAYDLVIDATADASVRSNIELARKNADVRPPLVTMVIGHNAERGLVTTNLPAATGAAADTFRKVSLLAASKTAEWVDIGDDLFPTTPRTKLFFPEPGCSSPTFVGSAAQSAALAGMMLHEALMVLHASDRGYREAAGGDPVSFASAVRMGAAAMIGTSRVSWPADLVQTDRSGEFEVRLSGTALAEARAEVQRGARVRAPEIETGGMLLGAFDDATGIVYIDKVTGPPPDSYLSATYFHHGVEGTQERVSAEVTRTASTCGFVGFWHSHPFGRAHPSQTDEQGMASIVAPDGTTRRALMMILGGDEAGWDTWRKGGPGGRPDIYLRVVPRSDGPVVDGHPGYVGGLNLQQLPPGWYFRGGSGGPVRVSRGGEPLAGPSGRPSSWWAWLRRRS
ncbi:ThiF family adenylyltransferase [Micromonospora aurantiaca]|uniref:ThiF family adenylyltransferase n=1 Tax=Micromonospora aurantiaca (nom. illeg.) TaxID=47850 RepID=UPI003455C208